MNHGSERPLKRNYMKKMSDKNKTFKEIVEELKPIKSQYKMLEKDGVGPFPEPGYNRLFRTKILERIIEGRKWKNKEFYTLQKWVSDQKNLHEGKIIAYAKIDGEWVVIADGCSDHEVLENLDKYRKEKGIDKNELFKCYFR